ncbi:GPN-loop GTPase 2 [Scaptodrosophila lebanonensis]|uniref:GPN-loop GTPase 2 n=1 Tax=Drosophila lebanonensis TaxID=7225 RepID=A0A6J2TK07_DROLE|nr:GPN-loop GTPase 2 [Scaptodrosophila lebanonensis]
MKVENPRYGQLVIGPPGSGKSTYCHEAYKFYENLGRQVGVVNLDPANDNMPYSPVVNIMELITVEDCMEHIKLGPNGALMHCAEYLEQHIDKWLLPALSKLGNKYNYFLFDCPGQIELYTHHNAMAHVFERLESERYSLVTVNLIDSHYCSEPSKFIATLLMALNTMLRMSLPHVNVLSKADLLRKHESMLHFNMDFYTDVLDLKYLLEKLDEDPAIHKYQKLNEAICSMVEDYALVSFQLLDVFNTDSMLRLHSHLDKANGYVYKAGEERTVNSLMTCAVGAETEAVRQQSDIEPYVRHK